MANSRNNIPGIFNVSHIFPPYREYHWFDGIDKFNIDLQNPAFSDEKAWFFSELCGLLYDDECFNRKVLTSKLNIQPQDIIWFRHKGNEALLINYHSSANKPVQIVVFQGTHLPRLSHTNFASITRTAENILVDDLLIEQIPQTVSNGVQSAEVNLHKGFVKALGGHESKSKDDGQNSLWGEINQHLKTDTPLWLTGHSLGGAMATIAAMKMPQQVTGLYTYGAPCVGDSKAKDWQQQQLKDKFYRYVNGSDIISHIMSEDKFRRHFYHYEQAGILKTINIQGCTGPFWLAERIMDRLGLSFIDHSPLYYMIGCYEEI